MATSDLLIHLSEALTVLPPRESRILSLRLGLVGDQPTLQEVGQELGISGERVRQLQKRAIRRLGAVRKREINPANGPLVEYLRASLRPGEDGETERICALLKEDMGDVHRLKPAIELIVRLAGYRSVQAKELLSMLHERIRKDAETNLNSSTFARFLDEAIIWPPIVQPAQLLRGRQREVNADGDGISGEFWSDKLCRTVAYESLLEYDFLLKLERSDRVALYQEQPFAIPYEAEGRARRYYPDVFFSLKDGRGVVVELKVCNQMALAANMVKWRTLRQFCEEQGYGRIITDNRATIQDYWNGAVPAGYKAALLMRLQSGPLSWREYRQIRDSYHATWRHFVGLVLQERLIWTLLPFRLQTRGSFGL